MANSIVASSLSVSKPAGEACSSCPRRDEPCVLPEIPGHVRLSLVGEAPGRSEVESGRPFTGASGRLMKRVLDAAGLGRANVHWTNAVLCPGPENTLAEARKHCEARLRNELAEVRAPVVMAAGSIALQSVLRSGRKPSIMKYRGSVVAPGSPIADVSVPVCPTFHPAFVLRSPTPELWEPLLARDVARAAKIGKAGFKPPEAEVATHVVFDLDELEARCAALADTVAFDVETTGLEATTVGLKCYALSDGKSAIVVPYEQLDLEHRVGSSAIVSRALSTRCMLTHNGPSYDHVVMARFGIELPERWDDSLLAQHALASHEPKRLGHVVATYLDAPPWKEEPHDESDAQLWNYNARDVIYTRRAWDGLGIAMGNDRALDVYHADKRCAALCTQMQLDGIGFDRERAALMEEGLAAEALRIEADVSLIAGRAVNILSVKDLGAAMFSELGAPIFFRTDKGSPSLGVDAMRAYAASANERISALATAVLRYRRLRKTLATYIRGAKLGPDGRVHPYWMNYGANTGRWSSNLMNLPRPENDPTTALGGIRSLYIAPPGRRLVSFDLKQLEMRIAAYWSGDETMIAACESADMHTANAELLFGDAFRNATGPIRKAMRTLAKTSGFAVCYLAGADTVYQRLLADGVVVELARLGYPVTLRHVEIMLETMHSRFARYYKAQDELYLDVVRNGYVTEPCSGRRRYVGYNPIHAEIANFPIQAGAAAFMNERLPELYEALRSPRYRRVLVAQVHDSATFEVDENDTESVQKACRDIMESATARYGRTVRFPVDVASGQRWSEV